MEPVVLPEMMSSEKVKAIKDDKKKWACIGHELDYANRSWIQPGQWQTSAMQQVNEEAAALYASWEKDVRVEEYLVDDAELIITAYGISARIAKSVVDMFRKEGVKLGLVRPITLCPFPTKSFDNIDYSKVKTILNVEMSIPAQYEKDVATAVKDRCVIKSCLCSGGNIMSRDAVIDAVNEILQR